MFNFVRRRLVHAVLFSVCSAAVVTAPSIAAHASGPTVFVPSAKVSGNNATFPLHEGRGPTGEQVWFVVIEASNSSAADRWNVEVVNKLENVRGGAQTGRLVNRKLTFEGSVDFTPVRSVQGSATGFPPVAASPGSIGDAKYSPIVRLGDGSVINAPQVANAHGVHDKVVAIDYVKRTVTLALTDGFARGDAVIYLSTDSSASDVAALEGATWAPRLKAAPAPGDDSTASGRSSLAAFVNGPTGSANPQRQGVNSALLGEGDPLNVLAWTPNQGRYSPLWDVHLTQWNRSSDARRITSFDDVEDLAEDGAVTGVGGESWRANDVVVNCPIIAMI
jgi:hypothetical protein